MTELVKIETGERLSIAAANRWLSGKTRITDKTHPDALDHWGLAVCEPVERPGDDYRLATHAEQVNGVWRQVWEKTPEPPIEQLRERQRQKLKNERIKRISAPINNIQVATPEDRENVKWAAANVESIDWIMADNTVQAVTGAELAAVADAYPLRKMQMFAVYAGLLEQLSVSDDPESIVWPE